jgi:integrase
MRQTGLRRGDAVRLGRQHIRNGVIRLPTEKTGEMAIIAVSDQLQRAIDATPADDLKFFGFTSKNAFGDWFVKAARVAGVDKSPYGLRKAAAISDAHAGWTDSELEAKFAWTGRKMASYYTRKAQREKLSLQAAERTKPAQNVPHLSTECPAPALKTMKDQ